eukprot:GDKJ01022854.1.p1 GENE.GDKJ01022854.1~~GDKJ01022854.1.p1  ORF type:complete len:484 (-),score=97.01 GDKJ01022854.1:5-1456(-)
MFHSIRRISSQNDIRMSIIRPLELFVKKTSSLDAKRSQRIEHEVQLTESGRSLANFVTLHDTLVERHRNHWSKAADDLLLYVPILSQGDLLQVMEVCYKVRSPHFKRLVDRLLARIVGEIAMYDTLTLLKIYPLFTAWLDHVSEIRYRLLEHECVSRVLAEHTKFNLENLIPFVFSVGVSEVRRERLFVEGLELEYQKQEKLKGGGELYGRDVEERQQKIRDKKRQTIQEKENLKDIALLQCEEGHELIVHSILDELNNEDVPLRVLCEAFWVVGWALRNKWINLDVEKGGIERKEIEQRMRVMFSSGVMNGCTLGEGLIALEGLGMIGLTNREVVRKWKNNFIVKGILSAGKVQIFDALHRMHLINCWNGGSGVGNDVIELLFQSAAGWIDKFKRHDRAEIVWLLDEAISVRSNNSVPPPIVSPLSRDFRSQGGKITFEEANVATDKLILMRNRRVFERTPRDETKWLKWGGLEEDARRFRG